MKTHPDKLTDLEWNLLSDLTTYNGMDCWFNLKSAVKRGKKIDYVYDLENKCDMSLYDGISQVAEGLVYSDLYRFTDGVDIWNGLVDRFSLGEYYRV